MKSTANGFAMIDNDTGLIHVDTVSDTRRAAQVNALFVYGRVAVVNAWTDEFINDLFTAYANDRNWRMVQIHIMEL